MSDVIAEIKPGVVVQHGMHNDRIYLMKLKNQDVEAVITELSQMALENKYSKIFCKIPKSVAPMFFANGYVFEAYIPKFYNNSEDVFFVSRFLNPKRRANIEDKQLYTLSNLLKDKTEKKPRESNTDYSFRLLSTADITEITGIYKEIFESYPFPIHSPDYIRETMKENIQYFGAVHKGKVVALASSEVDAEGKNAEMTDFATSSKHQGQGLSNILLGVMEKEMKSQGISTLYTIARLNSVPMNKTFLRADYQYTGTLIKNTNIAGKIESMNVYYKHL